VGNGDFREGRKPLIGRKGNRVLLRESGGVCGGGGEGEGEGASQGRRFGASNDSSDRGGERWAQLKGAGKRGYQRRRETTWGWDKKGAEGDMHEGCAHALGEGFFEWGGTESRV